MRGRELDVVCLFDYRFVCLLWSQIEGMKNGLESGHVMLSVCWAFMLHWVVYLLLVMTHFESPLPYEPSLAPKGCPSGLVGHLIGVFGRFDLAALCGCRTLNFCLFCLFDSLVLPFSRGRLLSVWLD